MLVAARRSLCLVYRRGVRVLRRGSSSLLPKGATSKREIGSRNRRTRRSPTRTEHSGAHRMLNTALAAQYTHIC